MEHIISVQNLNEDQLAIANRQQTMLNQLIAAMLNGDAFNVADGLSASVANQVEIVQVVGNIQYYEKEDHTDQEKSIWYARNIVANYIYLISKGIEANAAAIIAVGRAILILVMAYPKNLDESGGLQLEVKFDVNQPNDQLLGQHLPIVMQVILTKFGSSDSFQAEIYANLVVSAMSRFKFVHLDTEASSLRQWKDRLYEIARAESGNSKIFVLTSVMIRGIYHALALKQLHSQAVRFLATQPECIRDRFASNPPGCALIGVVTAGLVDLKKNAEIYGLGNSLDELVIRMIAASDFIRMNGIRFVKHARLYGYKKVLKHPYELLAKLLAPMIAGYIQSLGKKHELSKQMVVTKSAQDAMALATIWRDKFIDAKTTYAANQTLEQMLTKTLGEIATILSKLNVLYAKPVFKLPDVDENQLDFFAQANDEQIQQI